MKQPQNPCLVLGMGLLDDISGREHRLVLNAVQTGEQPGSVTVLGLVPHLRKCRWNSPN